MAIVELRDIEKSYTKGRETVDVLTGINLEIDAGDYLALMGPSGSGKTTLLNMIGGIDHPTSGSVVVGGESLNDMSGRALAKWRSRNVGFVFQFYNLLPVLNARRNVELPLLLTKLSGKQRKRNADTALEIVGLGDRASHKPGELSGGQQQRVAIRAGHRGGPGAPGLRRADGRPRPRYRGGDPRPAGDPEPRARQDHRDGDP